MAPETIAARRQRIAETVQALTADYQLQQEGEALWYCGPRRDEPGSFRVCCPRWAVILYGASQLILRPGDAYSLVWLIKEVRGKASPDELFRGTLVEPWPDMVFVRSQAEAYLKGSHLWRRLQRDRRWGHAPELAWVGLWEEGEMPGTCMDYSEAMLRGHGQLRRFVELLEGSRTASLV